MCVCECVREWSSVFIIYLLSYSHLDFTNFCHHTSSLFSTFSLPFSLLLFQGIKHAVVRKDLKINISEKMEKNTPENENENDYNSDKEVTNKNKNKNENENDNGDENGDNDISYTNNNNSTYTISDLYVFRCGKVGPCGSLGEVLR